MSTVNFSSDNSVQGTITTITSTPLGINLYAYNTNLSSLSSYSYLSINNINATSGTIFNNLNSLSTNSTLSINNLNNTSTTIFNNLNSLSTNSILNINGHTTQISNLNNTSTTIFNNLNSLSTNSILSINGHTTQISNLNNTSTTIFNNLNSLSTNSILSINSHTTQISNLNNTSTTIFNNLNSLSTNSIFYINNLNTTSTTVFNNLNSLSTNSIFYINNLNTTSTTIFNNLNSLSTNSTLSINNLNATSTSIFNKTNFTNLLVSNASTINSSLNVVGNIIGSGTALTNLNYNSILNPPTLVSFNNPSTFISTLNISGKATLSNASTCISSLNVSGLSTFSNKVGINTIPTNCNLEILGLANIHNGTRYAALNYNLNAGSLILGSTALNYGGGTNWNGGNAAGLMMECLDNTEIVVHDNGNRLASLMYYEGGATNRLTLGRNMGWDTLSSIVMNGNISCNNTLNVLGTTKIDNSVTCISTLNVSGITTLSNNVNINTVTNLSRLTLRMSYNDGFTGGFCIDSGDGTTYNLRLFSYVQASAQVGYHFQVNNISSSVNALTFDYDGGVNINKLRIGNKSIYNNLFNSGGFGHETLTNFNNITDYGYRFINTPATNGPGTPSTPANQYYSWFIGLGTEYAYNSYGAQFALPRKTANPILSIRYLDDAGVWGGWSGITAAALTSGDKTISGALTTTGNIDCGGGIAINGSTAFYNPSNTIDAGNLTNTYLNLKYAGADSDWCYIRQIGGNNTFKLAFDFHDDVDARFCIRSITSTANPDTVTEVFTVDNGNVSCTGTLNVLGNTTCLSTLNVSGITTLNNTTIVYGQLSTNGNFTNGTTSNLYAGGLRINGSDYNNTIYQDLTTIGTHSADIGFTLRNYSFFNFNSLSSGNINTNLCNMSMAGISLNTNVTCISSLNVSGFSILNNTTTINSSLNVSGLSRLNRIVTYNNTFPDLTAVNNATTHSIINVFPGINGQQGALTADLYNIYLSSFAYGTYMSGPQPYITVNCSMLYNGCNTKMTLQAYGSATGAGYNSKIILNGGNNSAGSTSFINDNVTTCVMNSSGVGIANSSPWATLNIGDCSATTDGFINFGKNSGGNRNCKVGYNSGFTFCIGDFGNVNNNSNNWSQQFGISYLAPQASLGIDSTGRVIMPNGYGTSSDERIKTNIKTIENALDKTLLLRGVEYNDIRVDPDKKRIGLIAQEVELIIPEVVGEGEMDKIKYISYGPLVGLLIEAIKDQQKQINELKNILKNNNLN